MKGAKKRFKYIFTFSVCLLCSTIGMAQTSAETVQNTEAKQYLYKYRSPLDTLTYQGSVPLTMYSVRYPSTAKMPFFCHLEHNLAKKSGFPVKFRLGDVNYVDMLESK